MAGRGVGAAHGRHCQGGAVVQADPREFTKEFIQEKPVDGVVDFYQLRLEAVRHH